MPQKTLELNCSRTSFALDSTLVVAVEMSLSTWLVCAEVPGLERRAMKKMSVDEAELLSQLHRWRDEAEKRLECRVSRICVAYEAGRDGFWLARFLRASGIEAHVMHSTSIPVNRDHRRAKTDRLDCHLMMRAFLALTPHRYKKSHSISVRISQFRCALTEALEFLSVENTDKRQFAQLGVL